MQGIIELAERGNAAWQIGWLAASALLSETQLLEFLRIALGPIVEQEGEILSRHNLIAGALRALDNEKRERVLSAIAKGLLDSDAVKLFLLAPFCRSTWKLIDALDEGARAKYWIEVSPDWIRDSDDERSEVACCRFN